MWRAALDKICSEIRYPKTNRADKGAKSVTRDLGLRPYWRDLTLAFLRQGNPAVHVSLSLSMATP